MIEDFGIIIACCQQDYLFAKGCCASIRHFLGEVPICLIVDGTFSVSDLEKTYGVQVINHLNVKHEVLRQRSFGWGITKMIAFWESPWENFLFLDADTIVWGNILKFANFKDYDIIIDKPCYDYSDEGISKYFFDIPELEQNFPDFRWQNHRSDYFCTGTFFAKRNIFSLEEYIEILDFIPQHPKVFAFGGEMSFLNFMIFRASDAGKIRLGQVDMQLIVPDFDQKELKKRFPVESTGPVVQGEDATVIHWCGPKPTVATSKAYADPMSFCRRKFLHDSQGLTGLGSEVVLRREDLQRDIAVYNKKVRRKLTKVMPKLVPSKV